MNNTAFCYKYCDGNNNKRGERIVLQGTITFEQLVPYLDEGEYFIPGQVGLEDLQHSFTSKSPGADHPWHRVYESDITPTDEPSTVQITAQALLAAFQAVTWDASYIWEGGVAPQTGNTRMSEDETDTGRTDFDLAMDIRRLLRARGEIPGEEPPRCDHCHTWTATHIISNRFLACDKPRCQDALEEAAKRP
jgi:hypothetical protein